MVGKFSVVQHLSISLCINSTLLYTTEVKSEYSYLHKSSKYQNRVFDKSTQMEESETWDMSLCELFSRVIFWKSGNNMCVLGEGGAGDVGAVSIFIFNNLFDFKFLAENVSLRIEAGKNCLFRMIIWKKKKYYDIEFQNIFFLYVIKK